MNMESEKTYEEEMTTKEFKYLCKHCGRKIKVKSITAEITIKESRKLDRYRQKQEEMTIVSNEYGEKFEFGAAHNAMDPEICEDINMDLAPCTPQEFFDEYIKRHAEKYDGEVWTLATNNPQW